MHNMTKISTLVSIILIWGSLPANAQNAAWAVSAADGAKVNSMEQTPKNIAAGKNVFSRSCAACHGAKADGKGLMESANLITPEFQKQTDGAIFYKINTGRAKMPPFKAMLKEEEVWSVVSYLRVMVNPSAMPAAVDVKLEIAANEDKSVTAFVYNADSTKMPLKEVDVHFYVKRNFGLMPIGQPSNFTGVDGKVTVQFPENIIGDLTGNVTVIAKIENNLIYNDIDAKTVQKWGTALVTEDAKFDVRALWASQGKSPIWLLLLEGAILIGVWSVVFFVISNLLKVKKAGKIFLK